MASRVDGKLEAGEGASQEETQKAEERPQEEEEGRRNEEDEEERGLQDCERLTRATLQGPLSGWRRSMYTHRRMDPQCNSKRNKPN